MYCDLQEESSEELSSDEDQVEIENTDVVILATKADEFLSSIEVHPIKSSRFAPFPRSGYMKKQMMIPMVIYSSIMTSLYLVIHFVVNTSTSRLVEVRLDPLMIK